MLAIVHILGDLCVVQATLYNCRLGRKQTKDIPQNPDNKGLNVFGASPAIHADNIAGLLETSSN